MCAVYSNDDDSNTDNDYGCTDNNYDDTDDNDNFSTMSDELYITVPR